MTLNTMNYPVKPVIVAVIVTALIFIGISYFTGFPSNLRSGNSESVHDHSNDTGQQETLYTCSMHPSVIKDEPGNCPLCGMKLVPVKNNDTATTNDENKIAYWRAPMNPSEIYDKPGKSAMGMDLVPVYENEVSGGVQISIDPVTVQNMGIRTAEAMNEPLNHTIKTYGHITYDETRVYQVNLRFSGWVEDIYVDYIGKEVKKGDPLFKVYSPELLTAQEEYLQALKNSGNDRFGKNMTVSAKRRLENYNISKQEIRKLEKEKKVMNSLIIRSPFNGIVTAKKIVKGSHFKAGTTVYTLSDISLVWVEAHIYEYEIPLLKPDMTAEMRLSYYPEKTYTGKVAYIYPYLEKKTRDVVIRLEFANEDLKLKPDMYADVMIKTLRNKKGTTIPSEAVLRSGESNIVFVTKGDGRFSPRNVVPGILLDNNKIEILSGVAPGETVVTSGQFMLDSESKLKEAIDKLRNPKKIKKKEPEAAADDGFFDEM